MAAGSVCTSSDFDENIMITAWDVKEIYRYKTSEMIYYDGERIRWCADYESLKKCIEYAFTQRGKWSSPGGNSKKFDSFNFDLSCTWYPGKLSSLLFRGKAASLVKECLIKAYMSSTLDEFRDNLKVCTTSITNVCDGVSSYNSDSIIEVNSVCQPSDVSQTNGQKQCIEVDQGNNSLITQDCASQTQNQNCDHLSEELRDALKKIDRLFDLTNNVYNSISRWIKETPVSCGNCMLGKSASGSNVDAQSISARDIGDKMRKCNELSIELEGVKLDAVITESRLSNNIYQNSKAIEQIHSQMINMQTDIQN